MKAVFDQLKKDYAYLFGVEVEAIEGNSRKYPLPEVRARILHEFRNQHPHVPLQTIGKWINMDHSSILTAIRNVNDGLYGGVKTGYKKFTSFTYPGTFNYQIV